MAVIEEMRNGFRRATVLMKLVWVNIAVFLLLRVTAIVLMFAGKPEVIDAVLRWVELPSEPSLLLTRPWTVFTYMFAQYDLMHILFNMLWFYWFGTIFRMRCTQWQLLSLYFLGGLGGAVLFLLCYNSMPLFWHTTGWLIGSSAAVMAIVTATAIMMPDFRMHFFLIGGVSLKWIAIASIVLVLVGISGTNAGGEIAHVGGILTGALFGIQMRKGNDITARLSRFFEMLEDKYDEVCENIRRRSVPRPSAGRPAYASSPSMTAADRAELDVILDKIKKSGYAGLTADERRRLFSLSRNIK